MSEKLYSPPFAKSSLRLRLLTLASALLLAPAAMAQLTVPAGNPNVGVQRRPLATWFGFERSALIYTPAEIGSSGTITAVGFYLNAVGTPGAAPTKVYLKAVSNSSFAAATTVAAEETGATLVYDGTIPATSFTANTWVTIPLATSFAYNGTSNLEVIVETNAGGGGNETSTGKAFRSIATTTAQAQYWSADNTAPSGNGTLSAARPNIQLTGLTSTCPAATDLAVSGLTPTGAQVTFTPGAGNTTYNVTYFPTATPANVTTVTPSPINSPITLTGLTPGTAYTVNIVANCVGSTTSQLTSVSFLTTLANDDCAGAITLTPSATSTCATTTNGTTTGATQSQAPSACSGSTSGAAGDVWYKFTATSTAHIVTASSTTLDGVVQAFSGACGSLTALNCVDATASGAETLALTGLTIGNVYYVRYYGYTDLTTPVGGAFTLCITTLPPNDAAVAAVYTTGKVSPLASPVTVQAVVRNGGSTAITNRTVTLNVTGATTFTNQQTIASLAPGASTVVTFATYPVTATSGTNAISVTLPADDDAANNTGTYSQAVTPAQLSYYDDASPLNATGVGVSSTTPNGILAVKYSVPQNTRVSEVRLNFPANATTTSTYQVVVLNATSTGAPGTVIYSSPTQNRPTAAGIVTVPVPGNVTVNGPFYIGLREVAGNVGIGYQVEDPLRSGVFFFQSPTTGAWADVNTTTLKTRLAIEVGLAVVTATRSAELSNAITLFPNPSNGQVALDVRAAHVQGALQVRVINALGQTVHTAELRNNFENQLNLSHLAAGIYTVKVQAGNEFTVRQLSLTK
ncbi:T9SS type A sorting domain-containing protein [Hymenobacter sp. CRA2]|uniref:T9SS type A sorting domain-containing protein n=1 Tax=Hymenobacter sp. CRA2 TaxID=1955620 RepID=UPI00098F6BCA|nr:T9SS type A sorting domain-containing protein [Hymenobacter sp. CRA2]OON68183.1 hypothetical protein B0919_13560 [Hymenobacter sp. CRA2]